MNEQTVRIGFIGAGDICRVRHLPGLAALNNVDVVAVCNRSSSSAERIAADFDIPEIVEDWKSLIHRPDLDAVFIGTWPYMHAEMSIACLQAGKHCFCQARMCMNLAEAKQMAETASACPELVNMICPPPTRMPFEPYVQQIIANNELGQIMMVQLDTVNGANLTTDSIHWRERIEFSGQQVMAMGIFAETMNAWVGPYQELSAYTSTPISEKTDESGNKIPIKIPQLVTITGRLESGALAVEHHNGVAGDKSTPATCLRIWGTGGTLQYHFGDTIEFAKSGNLLETVSVAPELQRPWLVERDFVNAVRDAERGELPETRPVSPDFNEGLLYMRKVEAVHRSAHTAQAIKPAQL